MELETAESEYLGPKKRGRKPGTRMVSDREKVVNTGACLPVYMVEYFQTWHTGGGISDALKEVYEDLRKVRPEGRFSAVRMTEEQRAAAAANPNTKRNLKKKIRELEKELDRLRKKVSENAA
jgi:hypothetical protein